MTDRPHGSHPEGAPEEERPGEGPVIRDKRRIDPETGKIEALVSIFGRETPVELTADQIERIM